MTGSDGSYTTYTYSNGAWSPSQPTISLGEAFWSNKAKAVVWRQNYSVWWSGERSRLGCTGRRPRRPDRCVSGRRHVFREVGAPRCGARNEVLLQVHSSRPLDAGLRSGGQWRCQTTSCAKTRQGGRWKLLRL